MKVLNNMIKNVILVMVLLVAGVLFACAKEDEKTPVENPTGGDQTPEEPVKLEKIKVILPSGAPLMAIGGLLDNDAFEFEVTNGPDALGPALMGNDYDIVIAPLNLGAKQHTLGKTSFKLDSIITTNNTYLVSKNSLSGVEDLNDINILGYGQNATPDIVLKAAKTKFNLNYKISYQASANDVMSLFISGSSEAEYILAAYPQVTVIKNKLAGQTINVLDVVSLFENSEVFPQACLYVNASKEKDYSAYLKLIEENIKLANEKPADYAKLIADKHAFFKSLGEDVLKDALPNTNIVYLKAKDNKAAVNQYVEYLNTYAPALLSGKTISDEFYN